MLEFIGECDVCGNGPRGLRKLIAYGIETCACTECLGDDEVDGTDQLRETPTDDRARFKADAEDYRPVLWPPPGPYWCTGYGGDGYSGHESYAIVVAYADNEAQILEFWPEASEIDTEPCDEYTFTDRFPNRTGGHPLHPSLSSPQR